MSLKKAQESGSYMDAIKVKIVEEYKPPPKINIPMTHIQRLTFNKQIQDNLPKYDFSMEDNVLQKVREWKNNRLMTKEQRNIRLQSLKDNEAEESETEEDTSPDDPDVPIASNDNERVISSVGPSYTTYPNGMLLPTRVANYYSNILQPIPLKSDNQNFTNNSSIKNSFNISEFEADTSSPFDNVALKSINDVEELAKVLKIEDIVSSSQPRTSTGVSYSNFNVISTLQSFPSYTTSNLIPSSSCDIQNSPTTVNGYYNSDIHSVRSFPSSYQCSPPLSNYLSTFTPNQFNMNNLPDDEKGGRVVNLTNTSTNSTESLNSVKKQNDVVIPKKDCVQDLPDPFDELPKHLQDLSRTISSMGFPLSRVARACKAIGNDNKKVVDHLLAMSELLDLGFAEDKISVALLLCDNNRDEALDKLIS